MLNVIYLSQSIMQLFAGKFLCSKYYGKDLSNSYVCWLTSKNVKEIEDFFIMTIKSRPRD